MPTFRFHRGGLQESLETRRVVNSKEELALYISEANTKVEKNELGTFGSFCPIMPSELEIKPYVFTYIVLHHPKCVTQDPYVIGFLSDNFPEQEKNEIPNS